MVRASVSPFVSAVLDPVLSLLRKRLGLSSRSFRAPLYRLFSLPTFLELALPRILHLFDTLGPRQREDIVWLAALHPASSCVAWVFLA